MVKSNISVINIHQAVLKIKALRRKDAALNDEMRILKRFHRAPSKIDQGEGVFYLAQDSNDDPFLIHRLIDEFERIVSTEILAHHR